MKRMLAFLGAGIFILMFYIYGFTQENIIICGTGDSQDLLRSIAAVFEAAHPGKKVEVSDSIGSSGGIKALLSGQCDLARVARPLKDKEKAPDLTFKVFAYSPVVFAVNASVTGVENLSAEQLIGIFSGRITSWDKVGGRASRIFVAARESGDSSLEVIRKNIPGWDKIDNFAGKTVYYTSEAMDVISKYDGTIGFVPLSLAVKNNCLVLKLDGVIPDAANVKSGKYKLVTPFALVWRGELKGTAKEFVDFLFGSEGKKIILSHGLVTVE